MNFYLPPSTRTGEEVARLLRRLIHSGELPEGSKLPPQRELAAQLGVSRATLREALAELEALNYVTTQRGAHGGTSVSALGSSPERWADRVRAAIAEFNDLCEYRIAMESRAAELAATRRSDDDLDVLQRAVDALVEGLQRPEFRAHDGAFHARIAAVSGSARLQEAIREARGEFFVPTDNLNFLPCVGTTRDGHAEILTAIRDRDPIAAGDAMTRHIENSRDELHQVLAMPDDELAASSPLRVAPLPERTR